MKIAVDFDGTIVDHEYPGIGKPKLFAFETLKALQKNRFQLILWTYRSGKELDQAVVYCKKNGIEFYAVNKSYPEEEYDDSISRKINVDIYIDDRIVGGFPGWSKIWEALNPNPLNDGVKKQLDKLPGSSSRKSIWQKIKKNIMKRTNSSLVSVTKRKLYEDKNN